MAERIKKFRESVFGRMLSAVIYLIMLGLVLIFFTGKGLFIYEAF